MVLVRRLKAVLDQAVEGRIRDRNTMVPVNASQGLYRPLTDGGKVTIPDNHSVANPEIVRVIDCAPLRPTRFSWPPNSGCVAMSIIAAAT